MKFVVVLVFVAFTLLSCSRFNKPHANQITEGLRGYVTVSAGDQMPSPDMPAAQSAGIKAVVYIYTLTNMQQVTRVGNTPFYSAIHTPLVQKVETDEKGFFQAKLPPGSYSVFTEVKGKYYANHFDQHNNIAPVHITESEVAEVNINVSASATY